MKVKSHSLYLFLVNLIINLFVRVLKCKREAEWLTLVEASTLCIHSFSVKGSLGGHFVTSDGVTYSLALDQLLC